MAPNIRPGSIPIVRFPEFQILDSDRDNRFDPRVDTVFDTQGNLLSVQRARKLLSNVEKKTGISNWRYLPLNETASFLNLLKKAQVNADRGDVEKTKHDLTQLKEVKGILSTQRLLTLSNGLLERALTKGLYSRIQAAFNLSKQGGDLDEVETHLSLARQHHQELTDNFSYNTPFDDAFAKKILKEAYIKGIPNSYTRAENLAKTGDIVRLKETLKSLESHVKKANERFLFGYIFDETHSNRILSSGYIRHVQLEWDQAWKDANNGDVEKLQQRFIDLQRTIEEANQELHIKIPYKDQMEAAWLLCWSKQGLKKSLK